MRFALIALPLLFAAPAFGQSPSEVERRLDRIEKVLRLPPIAQAPEVRVFALPMPTPAVSAVQYTAAADDSPVCANGRCSTSSRTTSTFQQSTGSGPLRRLFGR